MFVCKIQLGYRFEIHDARVNIHAHFMHNRVVFACVYQLSSRPLAIMAGKAP